MTRNDNNDNATRHGGKRRRRGRRSTKAAEDTRTPAPRHDAQPEPRNGSRAGAKPRSTAFAELGLATPLLDALARAGFETPTDIQRGLIPPALAGRDCLGQARTGTGKTAAFALPILQRVTPGGGMQAIVLVPTRELAAQVGEEIRRLSPGRPPRLLVAFGGANIATHLRQLAAGVDVLVGTPGRVLDLIQRRALDLADVRLAVLDEVDRMLDIGFRDDIRRIMGTVGRGRQTIFVSATMSDEIRTLARALMRDPLEVNVSGDSLSVAAIEQRYLSVDATGKFDALQSFFERTRPELAIVFTRTKRGATKVARRLTRANIACAEIHGGLAQGRRTRVLDDLRAGRLRVLVATDLASRGLDVTGVSHVVNYDIPVDPAVYVHRIGRTARMGASGHALTLVTPEQGAELTAIEKLINRELRQCESQSRRPATAAAPVRAAIAEPGGAAGSTPGRAGGTPGRAGGAPARVTGAARATRHAPAPQEQPAANPERHAPASDAADQPRRTLGGRFPARRRRL